MAIPIVNDEINEATEYFLIVLESTSPYADIVGRSASIGKILDDDSKHNDNNNYYHFICVFLEPGVIH